MTAHQQILAALEASNLSARIVVNSYFLEEAGYNRGETINALKSCGRAEYENTPDRSRKAEIACMAVLIRNAPRSLELIAEAVAARLQKKVADNAAADKLGWI